MRSLSLSLEDDEEEEPREDKLRSTVKNKSRVIIVQKKDRNKHGDGVDVRAEEDDCDDAVSADARSPEVSVKNARTQKKKTLKLN